MSDDQPPARVGVRWNPEVSLNGLLQMAVVAVAAIFFFARGQHDGATTARDLTRLEQTLTAGLAQQRADMQAGFAAMQLAIQNLPDINARLTQAERRIEAQDSRAIALDTRIGRISDALTETRAEVNGLARRDAPLGPQAPTRPTR
ncbi:hypothetical protein ACVFYP_22195 [Roseomonas sp. F4]